MSFSSSSTDGSTECVFLGENSSQDNYYISSNDKKCDSSLLKENTILKSQFEHALEIANQLKNVHKENSKLIIQNKALNTEIEELKKSLEFSNKARETAERNLEETKQILCSKTGINGINYQKEAERMRNVFKTQIDTLNDQVNTLMASKEGDVIAKKVLQNKVDKVIESARRYFNQTITDLDSLDILLNQIPTNCSNVDKREEKCIMQIQDKENERNNLYKRENKKLKKQLKLSLKKIAELERASEFEQKKNKENEDLLYKELESLKKEKDEIIESMNESILNKEKEIEKNKFAFQKRINQLEKPKVYELNKYRTVQISLEPIKVNNNKEIEEIKEKTSKIEKLIKVNKEMEEKLQENDLKNQELHSKLVKMEGDLESLKIISSESSKENDALRNSLTKLSEGMKQKEKENAKNTKIELMKQETTIEKLKENIESQKRHLLELENEKAKFKSIVKAQEAKIQKAKESNNELEEQNIQLHCDIKRIYDQCEQQKEDMQIPDSSWCHPDFPDALTARINSVVCNSFLKPVSKLQTVFRIINEHFNKQIASRNKVIREICNQMDEIKEKVTDFVVSISISVTGNATPFDSFISGVGSKILADQIKELKASHTELNQQLAIVHSYVDLVNSRLGISDNQNMNEMIEDANEYFETLQNQLECCAKIRKMYKKLKEKHSKLLENYENLQETNSIENSKQNKVIEQYTATNKHLEENNKQLLNDNRSLNEKNQEQEESIRIKEEELNQLNEKLTKKIKCIESCNERQMDDMKKNYDQQINRIMEENREKEMELEKLKSENELQKKEIEERDEEMKNIRKESSQNYEMLIKNKEMEKKTQAKSFEYSISEVKKQNEQNRKNLETVTNTLYSEQERNEMLKLQIVKLQREKNNLTKELQITKEESERERKLIQASSQSLIASKESELASTLGEKMSKFDKEKKRLFVYAISELGALTGTRSSIDEESFKEAIIAAKTLITKFTKSETAIRSIMGISNDQSIDEAVAQAFLN